jgi:zinc transporter ZupT
MSANSALEVGSAASLITLGGGLLALRLQARRGLVLGFCAGALVAGALLHVLPSALELAASSGALRPYHVFLACTLGLLAFAGLERVGHAHDEGPHQTGVSAVLAITAHSFLDGVAIGQGFRAGPETGAVVALAVLVHKLADGVGAMGLLLGGNHGRARRYGLFGLTALAPLLGVLAQALWPAPPAVLAAMLGWFAGAFLYLGLGCLLPEARVAGGRGIGAATLLGAGLIVLAERLAG